MQKGVPFIVKARAYLFHAVIACLALAVNVILFLFFAGSTVSACAELKRIDDSPFSEIVYAKEANGEQSFYYLSQQHIFGERPIAASCDILMTAGDMSYNMTPIYFDGDLDIGTCAVSKNLADKYGLNIGDTAHIVGADMSFKVVRMLPAQSGLDKEYKHDGVVVLAYNGELLNKTYSYVSFMTDGDAYRSLERLVFINDWKHDNVVVLIVGAVVFAVAFALTVVVCELFLFSRRRADYRIFAGLGKTSGMSFLSILAENALKYILPLELAVLIFMPQFICYGALYFLPVAYCAAVSVLTVVGYSFITVWRIYKCRAKLKK